jgi:hypothetical protein
MSNISDITRKKSSVRSATKVRINRKARHIRASGRARYLAKLYLHLKKVAYGDVSLNYVSLSQGSMTCFERLGELLEKHNITDVRGFLLSQFRYWGVDVYPGFLISKNAVGIFRRYQEETLPQVIDLRGFDNEEASLNALCEMRGESEEKVLFLLKDSGVFSPEFLEHKRRASHAKS